MANEFSNTSDTGLLKSYYDDVDFYKQKEKKPKSPTQAALENKRKSLYQTHLGRNVK